MNRAISFLVVVSFWFAAGPLRAEWGRDVIGQVTVTLIHASHEEVASVQTYPMLKKGITARLQRDPHLRFAHYRQLGVDQKPLFRSFENWAQPMAGCDDLLVRFEAQARPSRELTRLDLELWMSRKKILKTGAALSEKSPLYVLGPEWRQGRVILMVSLKHDAILVPPHQP
jgi:hypothetical protein